MQHAGEFVQMFAAAVYDAEIAELDRHVNYPLALMIPNMDITIADAVDLEEAVGVLRAGIIASGVERMERGIVSVMQTESSFAVVVLETRRFDKNENDLGAHQSTFVLDGIDDAWKVRSLTVINAPDNPAALRPVRRGFVRRYRHAENARWTSPPRRKTD